MVRAHQALPAWHHPNRLWRCVDYHLPNEEPHVFHPDHEEATGNSRSTLCARTIHCKWEFHLTTSVNIFSEIFCICMKVAPNVCASATLHKSKSLLHE